PLSSPTSPWLTRLGRAQFAASLLLVLALAWFELSSIDIGYHVAYGRRFLATGRIVQVDPFIYGATNHHFINANSLSQVIMAWLFDHCGWVGLFGLRVGLIAAIFACLIGTMRSLHAPAGWIGWACVAASLGAYERFSMRPELFSYAIMMAQLWLLVRGPTR